MKKAFCSLLGAIVFVGPLSFADAAVIGPLEEVKKALDHQKTLEYCGDRYTEFHCQDAVESLKAWDLDSVKEVLEINMNLVQVAIVKDEERLKEIQEIISQHPRSQHHYSQILAYGKLRIKDVTKHFQELTGLVPDLQLFLQTADLGKHMYVDLLKEKLLVIQANMKMALGNHNYEETYAKTNKILEQARQGSVVYQVPASTDKVAGMLPFFCEEESKRSSMLPCSANTLDVRFDVSLLKKILGVGKEDPVQLIIQKAATEGMPVLEMFSSILSGMDVNAAKKTISVHYYEYSICGLNGHSAMLGKAFCNQTIYMKKQIESRKVIEEALFNLIGETDQSLKLYAND